MKIVSIHDPQTSLLRSSYEGNDVNRMVRFTPSIDIFAEDENSIVYVMSYRIWLSNQMSKTPVRTTGDVGHPWVHFWRDSKIDSTAFCWLQVSRTNSRSVRVLYEYMPTSRAAKIDMRILRDPCKPTTYHTTFNNFGILHPKKYRKTYNLMGESNIKPVCFFYKTPKNVVHKQPTKTLLQKNRTLKEKHKTSILQQSWCTFQMKSTLTFRKDTLKPVFSNIGLTCPQHHQRFEKNHQVFMDANKKVNYQYALTPWTFFDSKCAKTVPDPATLFSRVANYYDPGNASYFSKSVQFSCSTPLISFTDKLYIAAGHFKIYYERSFPKGSPIDLFLKETKRVLSIKNLTYESHEDVIHPELLYGMFLYTVDKKTMKLDKVTRSFVPLYKSYKQALSFPSGITRHSSNEILVAYHENDMTIRLLSLTTDEITKMLSFDSQTSPSEYPFTYTPIR